MDTTFKMPRKGFLVAGLVVVALAAASLLTGCEAEKGAAKAEAEAVERQQQQYAKGQPVPSFDWSFERQQAIELYGLRNEKVATHAVWRSDLGTVEGDCASLGYGLPYDVSLTNPVQVEWHKYNGVAGVGIGQPEPNGVFQSSNTAATWVMCVDGAGGALAPVYVESKVTVYPYPVSVDYANNRVTKAGDASITISVD